MRAIIVACLFFFKPSNSEDVYSELEQPKTKLGDVCTCSELHDATGSNFVLNILCSLSDRTDFQDLDKIEWPNNPHNLKVSANFHALGITILAKLPANSQIETLTFNSNAINTYWPDPFSGLPNLRTLSFYQNDLSAISPDLFTNINLLEDLDLSYNKLSNFSILDFKTLVNLKRLNLQNNAIADIPIYALKPLVTLEELDLSRNSISGQLDLAGDQETLKALKRLFLGANRITTITTNSFRNGNKIELLDLSYNLIQSIDEDAFITCTNLQELNLSNNSITFVFQLPPMLQIALLKTNTMYHWPQFPSGIKLIDLSYNHLSDVYDENTANFENLEVLDISGNQIADFNIEKKLSNLITLDLSYNALSEIPKALNAELLPALKNLRLDGNPLEVIYFKNILILKNLYMSELDKLRIVEDKSFSNVLGRDDPVNGQESMDNNCFSLYLNNCPSLSEIRRGAFDGTSLCMLDISRNNLTTIPKDLLVWSSVIEGVNLQVNPWRCSCEMEWMLDEVLARMYNLNANLLLDLRCGSPRALQGLRLMHWYNWTERPMCGDLYDMYPKAGPHNTYVLESTTQGYKPKITTLTIVLIVCILVSLVVATSLIVYLVKTRKRYRARQAAMSRKRQSAIDAKQFNGVEKEQLNKA